MNREVFCDMDRGDLFPWAFARATRRHRTKPVHQKLPEFEMVRVSGQVRWPTEAAGIPPELG